MNARFYEKLARNPKLAQGTACCCCIRSGGGITLSCSTMAVALQNPAFSQAISDMQQDPRAAVLKYHKDPAVSTMLRDFMEFLGSHFEEVGKKRGLAS
jgi:hypothetical protein